MTKRGGVSGAVSALGLVGSFAYLLMLMFTPENLTAVESGDVLALEPYDQTVVTALVTALCVVGLALASGYSTGPAARRRYGIASLAASLVGMLLAVFVHSAAIPVAVAILYGMATACQMPAAARHCARLEGSQAAVAVAGSLLAAAAVVFVAGALSPAVWSAAFMGAVLCVSAVALAAVPSVVESSGEAMDAAPAGPWRLLGRACAELRFGWQPLVGGCVCALSFGFGWIHAAGDYVSAGEGYSSLGRLFGAVALLAAALWARRRPGSASPFAPLLFGAAIASVLAWMLGASEQGRTAALAVSSLSQLLFIGLVWVETLSTARDFAVPALLPCLATAAFLVVFAAGALLGEVLGAHVAETVVAVLYLAYVCLLYASALRSARASEGGGRPDESDAPAFDGVCAALTADYALSPRESEVLPLLVMGLSSPAIGARLFISAQTVKSHTHRIYGKLGIHSRDELSALFMERSRDMGLPL